MSHTYGHYELDNCTNPIAGVDIQEGDVVKVATKTADGKPYRVPVGTHEGFSDEGTPYGVAVYGAKAGERVDVAVDGIVGVRVNVGSEGTEVTRGGFVMVGLTSPIATPEPGTDFNVVIGQALGELDASVAGGVVMAVRLSFAPFIVPQGDDDDQSGGGGTGGG